MLSSRTPVQTRETCSSNKVNIRVTCPTYTNIKSASWPVAMRHLKAEIHMYTRNPAPRITMPEKCALMQKIESILYNN